MKNETINCNLTWPIESSSENVTHFAGLTQCYPTLDEASLLTRRSGRPCIRYM